MKMKILFFAAAVLCVAGMTDCVSQGAGNADSYGVVYEGSESDTDAPAVGNIKNATYIYGDIDGNNKLETTDALGILKYVVGLEMLDGDFMEELADMDHDHAITANDALEVLRCVVSLREPETYPTTPGATASAEDTDVPTTPEATVSAENTDVPATPEATETPGTKLQTATYTIKGVDFKMILVEAGTFTMGSDNTNVDFSESPAHTVTLTQDYLMGETEVTEALWNAVLGNGGGSNTHPKTSITWSEAHTFAEKLTALARAQGLISDEQSFRLPTEAQWEFAAKGGNFSQGYLYAGSNDIDEVAVTYENSGSNAPIDVKTKAPNELGLYDMSGNAYEWVDDYGGNYSADAQTDPQNTSGSSYVKRGGSNYHSFQSESYLFTTTGRYFYGSTDWTIGVRICLY